MVRDDDDEAEPAEPAEAAGDAADDDDNAIDTDLAVLVATVACRFLWTADLAGSNSDLAAANDLADKANDGLDDDNDDDDDDDDDGDGDEDEDEDEDEDDDDGSDRDADVWFRIDNDDTAALSIPVLRALCVLCFALGAKRSRHCVLRYSTQASIFTAQVLRQAVIHSLDLPNPLSSVDSSTCSVVVSSLAQPQSHSMLSTRSC